MTATTEVAKKPAAKPAAAEGEAAPKKKADPRAYRILKELRLDLTDPLSLVTQLQSVAGGDDENPEPVVVYVRVGEGKGVNPKEAIENFGGDNDMSGDYEVVADNSVRAFKDVSTEVKRKVSFS